MRIRSTAVLALVAVLAAAGCSSTATTPPSQGATTTPGAPTAGATSTASLPAATEMPTPAPTIGTECTPANLTLKHKNRLTVSTDNPAYPPWFEGKVPSGSDWASYGGYPPSGEGFESAIAYAVANALGFTSDQVKWVAQSAFGQAFKPGPKDFDFHLGQVSYRPKRAEAVDFSDSYYDVGQAIVALSANAIASVTTVEGLAGYTLGAAVGTTSYDAITNVIAPTTDPKVYDDVDKATTALKNGQIDGLVVDLPTAFYIRDAELKAGTIVGQLPQEGAQEYFGLVLEKDSPLTACVNQALATIKADGTYQQIYNQWLASDDQAPLLK
jgi:polar amino acid transport system substrate-binding protein